MRSLNSNHYTSHSGPPRALAPAAMVSQGAPQVLQSKMEQQEFQMTCAGRSQPHNDLKCASGRRRRPEGKYCEGNIAIRVNAISHTFVLRYAPISMSYGVFGAHPSHLLRCSSQLLIRNQILEEQNVEKPHQMEIKQNSRFVKPRR